MKIKNKKIYIFFLSVFLFYKIESRKISKRQYLRNLVFKKKLYIFGSIIELVLFYKLKKINESFNKDFHDTGWNFSIKDKVNFKINLLNLQDNKNNNITINNNLIIDIKILNQKYTIDQNKINKNEIDQKLIDSKFKYYFDYQGIDSLDIKKTEHNKLIQNDKDKDISFDEIYFDSNLINSFKNNQNNNEDEDFNIKVFLLLQYFDKINKTNNQNINSLNFDL